ncbi:hypothetical protein [Runella sp.]|uniref:hypothetical protein n=1 Tax=Runella sp. TaxID=1960881 RepID=UPI003D0E54DE
MENTDTPENQPTPGEPVSKEEHKSKIELAKWQFEQGFITEQQYNAIVNEHQDKLPE